MYFTVASVPRYRYSLNRGAIVYSGRLYTVRKISSKNPTKSIYQSNRAGGGSSPVHLSEDPVHLLLCSDVVCGEQLRLSLQPEDLRALSRDGLLQLAEPGLGQLPHNRLGRAALPALLLLLAPLPARQVSLLQDQVVLNTYRYQGRWLAVFRITHG